MLAPSRSVSYEGGSSSGVSVDIADHPGCMPEFTIQSGGVMSWAETYAEFPRGAIAIALTIGVPSFVIAAISTVFIIEHSVRSDVILAFKGHVIGGTADIAVAAVLAADSGQSGSCVYCGC